MALAVIYASAPSSSAAARDWVAFAGLRRWSAPPMHKSRQPAERFRPPSTQPFSLEYTVVVLVCSLRRRDKKRQKHVLCVAMLLSSLGLPLLQDLWLSSRRPSRTSYARWLPFVVAFNTANCHHIFPFELPNDRPLLGRHTDPAVDSRFQRSCAPSPDPHYCHYKLLSPRALRIFCFRPWSCGPYTCDQVIFNFHFLCSSLRNCATRFPSHHGQERHYGQDRSPRVAGGGERPWSGGAKEGGSFQHSVSSGAEGRCWSADEEPLQEVLVVWCVPRISRIPDSSWT